MTCVCGCPCRSRSGGPLPPWRTQIVASGVGRRVREKDGNMEVASSRGWSRRQACSNLICEVLNWSSTSARIRAALDCSFPANSLNAASLLRKSKNRTLVKITPAHLELLGRTFAADEVVCMTRCFVIGGENLRAENLTLWRNFAPATRLINEYGPTETVVSCCVYEVGPDDPHDGSIPIGRPIANTQLYVLGADLEPVPPGAVGELYIGGAGVARGCLNRPELTEERFVVDPFFGGPEARMYKTGDLARYRPDGVLEYLGRVDSQVKIRGHRVELGQIEAVLAGNARVRACVVLAREDAPGDKELVAYVVPEGEAPAGGLAPALPRRPPTTISRAPRPSGRLPRSGRSSSSASGSASARTCSISARIRFWQCGRCRRSATPSTSMSRPATSSSTRRSPGLPA